MTRRAECFTWNILVTRTVHPLWRVFRYPALSSDPQCLHAAGMSEQELFLDDRF
jgi:hypothetical protein